MRSSWPGRAAVTAERAASARVDPMLLVDDDRRCLDANDAACLFLRLPRDAVLALRIDDLIDAELRDGIDALWHRFLASGTSARPRPVRRGSCGCPMQRA